MYRVNHLVYRYQTKPVFSPCNLEIARGEYLVLMGDNGSGKSTFLNLLAGFLKPSEGTIYFMEQSLTAWKKDPIHKKSIMLIWVYYFKRRTHNYLMQQFMTNWHLALDSSNYPSMK